MRPRPPGSGELRPLLEKRFGEIFPCIELRIIEIGRRAECRAAEKSIAIESREGEEGVPVEQRLGKISELLEVTPGESCPQFEIGPRKIGILIETNFEELGHPTEAGLLKGHRPMKLRPVKSRVGSEGRFFSGHPTQKMTLHEIPFP